MEREREREQQTFSTNLHLQQNLIHMYTEYIHCCVQKVMLCFVQITHSQ